MRKRLLPLVWILMFAFLTACAAPSPSPTSALAQASPAVTSSPTATLPVFTPTATASPTPSVTPTEPPPPLSRPLYPDTWVHDIAYGAAVPERGMVLRLGRGYTFTADLSPDGNELALARLYGVYLCSLPTAQEVPLDCHAYLDHQGLPVMRVRYSPDGKTLATLDPVGTVRLWDLQHPDAPPQILPLFPERAAYKFWSYIGGLDFSPDGRYLAAADSFRLALWDFQTGQAVPLGEPINLPELPDSPKWQTVAFAPDGRLAAGSREGILLLMDPAHPEDAQISALLQDDAIQDMAFTSQGDLLCLSWSNVLLRVSAQTAKTVAEWKAPPEHPLMSRFHAIGVESDVARLAPRGFGTYPFREGELLLPTAGGSLLLLTPDDLKLTHTLQRPRAPFYFDESVFASFTPDGQRIVGVWGDGTVVVWDAPQETVLGHAPDRANLGLGVAFDPLEREMRVGFRNSLGWTWNLPTGDVYSVGLGHRRVYSSDGCFALPYHFSTPDTLEVYRFCQWPPIEEEITLKLEGAPFGSFFVPPAFLEPHPWVAVVPEEGDPVAIYSLEDGALLRTLQDQRLGGAYALAANPFTGQLYQGDKSGRIGVWDPASGQLKALWQVTISRLNGSTVTETAQITALALSTDGNTLAVAFNDGLIALLDAVSGKVLKAANLSDFGLKESTPLKSLTLASGGRFLLGIGSYLDKLIVLDMQKNYLGATIPLAGDSFTESFALSPDERLVAVTGFEGSVAVWDLAALLAAQDEVHDLLPMPVLPEGNNALPAYHTRYTVSLTTGEQPLTLLEVTQEGTRDEDPPRRHLTFQGAGWPLSGEAIWRAVDWFDFGTTIARVQAEGKWYLTNLLPVPPTAPVLHPWGWVYQGFQEGAHYYRSTDPASAALPPLAWLTRALDEGGGVFLPQAFTGEVALSPEGGLLKADLVWEGVIRTPDGNNQKARLEAHYRLEGTEEVEITFPADEDIVLPGGLVSASEKMVGEFPLYPGMLKDTEKPGTYFIRQSAEQVVAWYEEQLPLYEFTDIKVEQESILGLLTTYYLSAKKDGRGYQLIITYTLGVTSITFPTTGP